MELNGRTMIRKYFGCAHFSGTAARTDPSLTSSSPTFYHRPSVDSSPHPAFRDPYYTSRLNFIRGMSHHSHEYEH